MAGQADEDAFFEAFMAKKPRSFLHIDWSGVLQPKSFIRRTKLTCKKRPLIDSFAEILDLGMLSYFGEKHLWGDRTEWATACRELTCEWIRRERHAEEISRLHCLFGFETSEDVGSFCEREKIQAPSIWQVFAVDYSERKDMRWFDRPGTLMEKMFFADCYWRGEQSDATPSWEFLLHPAVYVEERIGGTSGKEPDRTAQ